MDNDTLIPMLAIVTLVIVVAAALFLRGRVAKSKGDPARSSFTEHHGEAPRQNRPGTDH
ncbi:hypothetical protein [Methylobacterium sp. A54F]